MPKSTSLKIHTIFGSPLRIVISLFFSFSLFGTPLSLKNTPYFSSNSSLSIVIYYTAWCPPCTKSLDLFKEIKKSHPKLCITTVDVGNPHALQEAKAFGLSQSVPLILIADRSGAVVKRFSAIPNKAILNSLIQRLEEGRLENGTLPADQRIDSWKQNRQGM